MSRYTEPEHHRSALITIDTQRDTLDGQPFEIPGTSEAVPRMAALAASFRDRGLPIVHVVRIYLPDGSNVDIARRESVEGGAALVLAGSEGVQVAEPLLPAADVRIDTRLLLDGGFQEPNCPRASIYEASERDFRLVAIADAISGLYERGRDELEGIGVGVMSTQDYLATASA